MHSTGEHVHILRNAVDKLVRAYSLHWNNFLRSNAVKLQALLNVHVSLYFSLDGQMNMSYTGQNPQTTKQERK